ncbi:hypothetical protein LLEC1_00997 [Akanthomyces lecanii]|uniref:Amidohydrolase-related domain-containing protein n=1 Tax=Cordyceps confragosa TaxID=2714763 RepID=A0A179IFV1_CORDF|nr:hypothetical protein LLEC1_00997 [Akanthomyces lecanii]
MRSMLVALLCGIAAAAGTTNTKLLFGGTIIAFDSKTDSLKIIRNGSVLIRGDRIAAVTAIARPADLPADTEAVDFTGQIITPGFVDTHRHGWQTALKTLGSNTSLAEYFGRYGEFAAADKYGPEDVYLGQLAGLLEAINAGVTTTLDHAHHTWSNATAYAGLKASIESGARVFWAYAFHNIPSLNYTVPDQVPNFREIADGDLLKGSTVELGIAYDAWGQDHGESLQVVQLAREYNVSVVTTHCLAGAWGILNQPRDLDVYGILSDSIPVVFSHASLLTADDAQLLRARNQFISVTPESEMHYGHTHPHSHLILDQASIGVDTHFTYSTDILTQARFWLQSVRRHLYANVLDEWRIPSTTPMSAGQAFLLATRNGGLALRRRDLGVIEAGAKADIVVWDARQSPSLLGWRDPVAAVLLHASVADVLHVLVDGQFRKRDGKLVAPDYQDLRAKFQASAEKIQTRWMQTPYPVLQGQFMSGWDFEAPKVVDAVRGDGDGYTGPFLD